MNAIVSQVNIYQSYSKELDARRIQISEERWKHVLVFRRYLSTKVELERSTMQHTLRRLSDSFFYHEKKRYLTRPNFLISLKENELKLPPSIAKLIYEAFDVLQNNTFDWRTFIFMLHVTSRDIEEDVKIFIKLAYRFRVGLVIDLNEPCNSCIQFQDIGKVFEMILHPNKVQPTLALFDEVWSKNETSSRIDNAGQQMTPFVSYTNFEKVLEEITVLNMVNSDTSVKNAFEQEYFPYTLYKYRRCIRYMSHFVTLSSTKIKSRCLREWQRVSKLQRLMRDFFGKYIERRDHLMKALAYSCLWQQTIMQNAAISIQRIIRTHRANVTILTLRTERSAIILVQTSIRSFIAKCRIHHLRQEREDAALAIQRCIRGTIGRHLACNRLLTAIDVRRLYELEQEGMLRHEEVIRRAIVIQRMYRHKIATRKFSEAVEKKARERIVADAIQTLQVEEEREERIHREQIRVHAQVSLEKYEIERYNESKAAAAKDEVRKLHIRLLEKERYDKQRKETQLEIEMREKKRDAMTNKWIEKESDACNDLEKKCLHCLYSPETPSERKEGKKIRQMIKKRWVQIFNSTHLFNFTKLSSYIFGQSRKSSRKS